MIRNIIFDWSGTLVDDLPAVWQSTNHVFKLAGVAEISLETFRAEFCLPFKHFYDRFIPHVPVEELEQAFHGKFKDVQDLVVELPHARAFLEACRANSIRTFVLSSVLPEHFHKQASSIGFEIFLDKCYPGIWDKREKIKTLLAENQLDPGETVFIGDMQHDIETARHGGVLSCGVLTGYNSLEQLRQAHPTLIVEHLGELLTILAENGWTSLQSSSRSLEAFPVATVGAVIFNEAGQALMIRTYKWSNLWGIPGGKIKRGETALEALKREILEETNLTVEGEQFVLVQDCIDSSEFYKRAHFLLLNYTCIAPGAQEARLNHEAQEFRWVSLEQALRMSLNTPTKVLIQKIMENSR
jgi:phosphoglycolate phosphatase-like HAD superfamily hydrolase/ADP-ribose pyrophosphatase YjhB (NUDIX family)